MANLLDKASILLTPTAYDNGSMLSIKPTNGDGDFTFSRNSAATRVNAQGLVENVQILSGDLVQNGSFSQIGAEEVTNGDFATDSNWSKAVGTTISDGKLNITANSTNDRTYQNVGMVQGKIYKLVLEVSNYQSGSLFILFGGSSTPNIPNITSNGTYTFYQECIGANGFFYLGGNLFDGSIDNVSVKEVGQNWSFGDGFTPDQANSKATCDGTQSAATNLIQTISTNIQNKLVRISFTLNISAGALSGSLNNSGGAEFSNLTTSGSYTAEATSGDINPTILLQGDANFIGSITNIVIKEVTNDTNLPRINYEGFSYQDSLGSELITNGDFSTNSDWNLQTGWSISDGKLRASNVSGTNAVQNQAFTQGVTYKITYTISDYVKGEVRARLVGGGGGGDLTKNSSNGTFTEYFVSNENHTSFRIRGENTDGGFTGSIDNVSVKEVTGQEVVPDSGCGSWLLEPQSTNIYLNSETLSTQDNTTLASTYTVSFYGTGTITFSGTHTGSLVGTSLTDRVSATFTATAGTLTSTVTGTVTKGQLEQQSYATSYIPTSGASSTRNRDLATDSGNATLINSTEGVLYAEIAALANDGTNRYISINNGGTTDYLFFRYRSDNQFQVRYRSGNIDSLNTTFTLSNNLNFNKIAFSYKLNEFKIFVNGLQIGSTITSGGVFATTINSLDFEKFDGAENFYGKTKALAVYKEALTDAELTLLTTI